MTKASELRELTDEVLDSVWSRRRTSCSRSGSRTRPASSTSTTGSPSSGATIARISTLLREREIAAAEAQTQEA